MFRIEERGDDLFSVSRYYKPFDGWIIVKRNGQDTFTTRQAAETFMANLQEIEKIGASYQ